MIPFAAQLDVKPAFNKQIPWWEFATGQRILSFEAIQLCVTDIDALECLSAFAGPPP